MKFFDVEYVEEKPSSEFDTTTTSDPKRHFSYALNLIFEMLEQQSNKHNCMH